ncbi:sigma-54 interaction domain-containing protein [Aminipila luticellarii]|uniref:PAS domain-containing protein n=1 Tax=Aminipila luticellarii TaxID=2507160 RepID=A0A410PRY7_9FIRM|nr:sigma 54-interacting transcriptional regulator [Aminipila luticellarii]QAT41751.1 PAS domain-containing protein [Aminipila luticellarii]
MDQVLAICKIREKVKNLELQLKNHPADTLVQEIFNDLGVFLDKGIDFKEVVDNLDDSIFITDENGVVLYVNPAHFQNTGITPEEVLNRRTADLIKEKVFTGGATLDVIKHKEKIFRLSTTYRTRPPRVGYAVGVPIFDENKKLHQVVVSSRPILSLHALHNDYGRFLTELKSVDSKSTIRIVDNALPDEPARLVGASISLKKVWNIIDKVADTDATVLITGESGVGKEIVADELYKKSSRKDKPFIKVNCASIPATLLESELFGYEKGAFSGASASGKQGLFELSNNGTLMLDEIGDMPMDLQVKLLRAIQNKEITRIGGTKTIPLDIRFIALTNSNLKEKIKNGQFRSDLYYRLNVIPIHIPPLRERIADIKPLCDFFVKMYTEKHHKYISLNPAQIIFFEHYNWPGNIRELENVIEYLTICSSGIGEVDDDLIKGLLDISNSALAPEEPVGTLNDSVELHEKALIEEALRKTKNLREAGALLHVNASTVSRKIKQYNINYNEIKAHR